MAKNESGYIYIIEDEPNICKIGISRNFPKTRNAQLSTKHHRFFKIRGYCKSEHLLAEEKFIHQELKKYRIRGEWFKLSYDEIKEKLKDAFEFTNHYELNNLDLKFTPVFCQLIKECIEEDNLKITVQEWMRNVIIDSFLEQLKSKNPSFQSKMDDIIGNNLDNLEEITLRGVE